MTDLNREPTLKEKGNIFILISQLVEMMIADNDFRILCFNLKI